MAEEKKDNLTEEEIEENEDVEDQTDEGSGESGKDNKSGGDKGSNKGGKSEKTFTQDQVNRMMTREKNQGRNAVYKELGIDPKDTKTVAQFKAFIESQKTEEQKAAEKESADKAKQAESEHRVAVAEAKAEAMMMGVKPQYVEDAVTLILAKLGEDTDVKTLLGELKTKYPIWFGESDDEDDKGAKSKTGQKGTGSSVKQAEKGGKKGEAEKGLGARLAAQRKSGAKKSSYWGANK